MDELEKKINDVLDSINSTFDVVVSDSDDSNDEKIVTKISLENMKNDGSDFVEKFCSLFGPLIEQVSEGKSELVYQEDTGLIIKKHN